MIDDHGVKQPIYETHRRFYEKARAFVAEEIRRTGRPPDDEQFRRKRWGSWTNKESSCRHARQAK